MRTSQQVESDLKAAKTAAAEAVAAKANLKAKAKAAEKKAADDLVSATSDKVKGLQAELKAAKAAEKAAAAKPAVVTAEQAKAEEKAAAAKPAVVTAEDPAALARRTIESDSRVAVTLTGGGKDSQTVMVIPGTPLQDVLKDIGWSLNQTFKKVGDNNQPGAQVELATRITGPTKIVAQPRSTGGN